MKGKVRDVGDFSVRLDRSRAELIERARQHARDRSVAEQWITSLLGRLNRDPGFRIQALRFIDVLPAVSEDDELVRLFREYFDADDFPLPGIGKIALRSGGLIGNRALAGLIRKSAAMLSGKFMGGADSHDVLRRMASLERLGRRVSFDHVGESTLSDSEATRYLGVYFDLLKQTSGSSRWPLGISVKISSLYSRLAPRSLEHGVEEVLPRLTSLARAARSAGAGLTLDMEDYDKRPLTFAVFERLSMSEGLQDWTGLSVAVQAYLRDVSDDVDHLLAFAERRGAPFGIRLVRGAYWDQEVVRALQQAWPVPVWQCQAETDAAYAACIDRLLQAHPLVTTAVATHNPTSLAHAMLRAEFEGLSASDLEFQMLYGMAEPFQAALVELGYRLRVYLPFGQPIPGMAYLVRRLLENASSQSLQRMGLVGADSSSLDEDRAHGDPEKSSPYLAPVFVNEPVRRFVDATERQVFAEAIGDVARALGGSYPLRIGGSSLETDRHLDSNCPADPNRVVGRVAMANRAAADEAIRAAREAWPEWRERSLSERAVLLREAARRLREQRDAFAAWEIYEAGKNWAEADADVCEAIDFLNYYADQAEGLEVDRGIDAPGEVNRYFYRPRGIGVVIPPWNFPLAILTGMLSATLVSGNCAILKPSSDTPVVAARFFDLLAAAGFPPGVIGFLPGRGSEVGEYLVAHPDVHLLAFTGSLAVGQHLLEQAAKPREGQQHVKRVIAEMGGKNAIIVDASADPDEAVAGILQSAFGYQGQKCSACSRVIVVGSGYRALVDRIAEATADLVMAAPWEPHCDLGPVINAAARERIEGVIADAGRQAKRVYRGSVPDHLEGHYVAPAVFCDVAPDSALAQDEIFGPVLAVMPAADFDQALAIANGTAYALTGGVYSRSPRHLDQAASEFRVGNLYLNRGITGALVARQPFGGAKLSGVGSKAGGPDYLLQFMEPKCVAENTMRRGVAPGRI